MKRRLWAIVSATPVALILPLVPPPLQTPQTNQPSEPPTEMTPAFAHQLTNDDVGDYTCPISRGPYSPHSHHAFALTYLTPASLPSFVLYPTTTITLTLVIIIPTSRFRHLHGHQDTRVCLSASPLRAASDEPLITAASGAASRT